MTRKEIVVLALAVSACGNDAGPDHPDAAASPACAEATTYRNLASIETKIFKASCTFAACHDGSGTDAGRIDLREGHAFASLVGVTSRIDPSRTLVVAGEPSRSFLLLMIGEVPPDRMSPPAAAIPTPPGPMPLSTGEPLTLCPEKRGAISGWIAAGAAND